MYICKYVHLEIYHGKFYFYFIAEKYKIFNLNIYIYVI